MAYRLLVSARFGLENSNNTDENNTGLCKTEKRKASNVQVKLQRKQKNPDIRRFLDGGLSRYCRLRS